MSMGDFRGANVGTLELVMRVERPTGLVTERRRRYWPSNAPRVLAAEQHDEAARTFAKSKPCWRRK